MAGVALTPRVQLLAFCDNVKESRTQPGVFRLGGVRQEIVAPTFPFRPKRLFLFLVLSYHRAGDFPCYVRVANDRDDRTIFYGYLEPRPEFGTSGGFWRGYVEIQSAIPEPGRYSAHVCFFQNEGNDIVKGETSLFVLEEDELP